eukprot:gb/GECG01008533.1/.p1 GENE.gb/GECG01008533.1/~~gb/GECG01008533.1/.p1  ORF type:complete len:117 (+),score=14.60 gb/GECG01008533.1/:1-351(+)
MSQHQEGKLIGIIADEDTVTGFLLTGIGCTDGQSSNYFVVDEKTSVSDIEDRFTELVTRDDIGLLFITQEVAGDIRHVIQRHEKDQTVVMEIPSKDKPYDPNADPVMQRVQQLLGM